MKFDKLFVSTLEKRSINFNLKGCAPIGMQLEGWHSILWKYNVSEDTLYPPYIYIHKKTVKNSHNYYHNSFTKKQKTTCQLFCHITQ